MHEYWKNSLKLLGFGDSHVESLELALSMPSGAIIACGPTYSGKSKTLQTLMQAPLREKNRATPQMDFAKILEEEFWRDPDLYYFPEIRDERGVAACADIVNTGHRVLTKLHAISAFDIPVRLHLMGKLSEGEVARFKFSALIGQKLFNCVCGECSLSLAEFTESDNLEDWVAPALEQNIPADQRHRLRFRNSVGCASCQAGYTGRTAVVEVVTPDAPMLECLQNLEWEKAAKMFHDAGGKFMIDHALEKAMTGQVDLRDIRQRIGFDYLEEIRRPQS